MTKKRKPGYSQLFNIQNKMLEELKKICIEIRSWDYGFSENQILECATRIYNAGNINRGNNAKSDIPATVKQVALLKKLKITIPNGLTKLEASKLIDEKTRKYKESQETTRRSNIL